MVKDLSNEPDLPVKEKDDALPVLPDELPALVPTDFTPPEKPRFRSERKADHTPTETPKLTPAIKPAIIAQPNPQEKTYHFLGMEIHHTPPKPHGSHAQHDTSVVVNTSAAVSAPMQNHKVDLVKRPATHSSDTKHFAAKAKPSEHHDKFSDLNHAKDIIDKIAAKKHTVKELAEMWKDAARSLDSAGIQIKGKEVADGVRIDNKKLAGHLSTEIEALAKSLKSGDTKDIKAHTATVSAESFMGINAALKTEQAKLNKQPSREI